MRSAIARLVRMLFSKRPSPKVSKPQITKHQPPKQNHSRQAKPDPNEQNQDRYWRDKLASEDDRKSNFRERYRSRLEEEHTQGQGQSMGGGD